MVREHASARRNDTAAPQSLRRAEDDLALAPSSDGDSITRSSVQIAALAPELEGARGPEPIDESGDGASDLDQPYDRVRDYAPAARPRSGCVVEQLRIDLRDRDDDQSRAALRFVELAERVAPHVCKAPR